MSGMINQEIWTKRLPGQTVTINSMNNQYPKGIGDEKGIV